MLWSVAERGSYWYHYSEYMLLSLMKLCCNCCCKNRPSFKRRLKHFKRHEKAKEKLADEIDITKLLYVQRIGQFISKLLLKKHERALITTFKKYQIEALGVRELDSDSDSNGNGASLLSLASSGDENFDYFGTVTNDAGLNDD